MSTTILPPTVTKDEAGVRFWDTRYNESPAWSEVRTDGDTLVSFLGKPWKPLLDCTPEERAIVIALGNLNRSLPHYDGLCELIADWTDDEVVERLEVSPAEVPWLREARGDHWSLLTAKVLESYLGMSHQEFFDRVTRN